MQIVHPKEDQIKRRFTYYDIIDFRVLFGYNFNVPAVLKYPLKSHRKLIHYPSESIILAEFLGILFGDGGVTNDWQVVISLNASADFKYSQYVSELFQRLFSVIPAVRKRPNQNTLVVVGSGINLIEFLVSKGVVRGNKISQQFDIPEWIRGDLEYKRYFVRGLGDTDGGLYTHNHKVSGKTYLNLGFCFTSYSKKLLYSVASIYEEFGIIPHIDKQERRISLYSQAAVLKYLKVFGSSNPRLLEKYENWRGV